MKGVIVAAGYGTRFLPASKTIPKEMFPLIDKPAIAFIVEEFIASGIKEILIISSRRKKSMEDYFDREIELETVFTKEGNNEKLEKIKTDDALIYFVRQKEMRGTGDALLLAESFAGDEPLCIAYPDDIVFSKKPLAAQLEAAMGNKNEAILGVMQVPFAETDRYGIVEVDNQQVSKIIEKPPAGTAPSNQAVIGRFIIPPSIFPLLKEEKEKNPSGEFYHIDPLNILAKQGLVKAIPFEGLRVDVGDTLGYVKAIIEYGLMRDDIKEPLQDFLDKKGNN